MNNQFEQLIEYVINDEEDKARALFHEIVVDKSRAIYEEMMSDEEKVDEAEESDDEEAVEESMHDSMEEAMGGDAADDLIDDIESEEQGMSEAEDEDGMDDDDHHDDMGGNEELEDRVVDLEDKLDELMAEFEALMGDDMDDDMHGGDELEMDDTEEFGDDEGDIEFGGSEEEIMPEMNKMAMEEAVSLKAAPKPVTSEEGSVNKKSTVAANSGAAGMAAKPVHMTGTEAKGRPDPTAKELISDFQNKAGANMKDQHAAPKPVTSQASGVNTKSPLAKA
jgi:hypothetical protein